MPALFLKFAYDKAFNQSLYDVAMVEISILGIVGIDELMLGSKVLDRIPAIKKLIKWVWREEVILDDLIRGVTKSDFLSSVSEFNNNANSALANQCKKELNLIDDNQLGDVKKHVSKEEIENAFKPYFETIQPFKMEMLKECYEKIEFLYCELKKLNEIM